jgi:hypothetical protein
MNILMDDQTDSRCGLSALKPPERRTLFENQLGFGTGM